MGTPQKKSKAEDTSPAANGAAAKAPVLISTAKSQEATRSPASAAPTKPSPETSTALPSFPRAPKTAVTSGSPFSQAAAASSEKEKPS
jgi:hypothetical protein